MTEPDKPADLPMVHVADDGEIIEQPIINGISPAQAKANAIASATMSAYAKASELQLTPEENKALAAEFPDDAFRAGAGGDDRLIYIEHAFLRDRLNDVLGRGAWALVTRSKWTEEYKTSKGAPAVRVYAEVMLMVRGCFVAEAVGEMEYYPHNAKTTYADAIEGSKTAAFRRCAKDFGIGLQAWKKGWTEGWWQRKTKGSSKAAEAAPSLSDTQIAAWTKLCSNAAMEGTQAYKAAWKAIGIPGQHALVAKHEGWKKEAAGNDGGDARET